jgi:hypothetical protein
MDIKPLNYPLTVDEEFRRNLEERLGPTSRAWLDTHLVVIGPDKGDENEEV